MFSSSEDKFIELTQPDASTQKDQGGKNNEQNEDIFNRIKLSNSSRSANCKSRVQYSTTKGEIVDYEIKNLSHTDLSDSEENNSSSNTNPWEEYDETVLIEKDEELENLISSFSEIPESYCAEEGENALEIKMSGTRPSVNNRYNLDNFCGLCDIKETLFNIFIYPSIYPHLFPEKIRWNQILLYGPPGTGKTMLANMIATEINAVLLRISTADLLSHWQGETEKQIRNLFEEARSSPERTVLFFDEIDGLCRKRTSNEDDSVRRIKTELLTQLDNFMSVPEYNQTYIIGATNCPWEIDSGFMRRFHKKIYIPLPNKKARLDILKKSFDNIKTDLTESEWDEIGKNTEGYSGSDLVNVAMTSCCERFTQIKKSKYWEPKGDLWVPSTSCAIFSTRMNFEDIHPSKVASRNIIFTDLKAAVANTPKTVGSEELFKYLEFSTSIK